jgi:hypothetical protein
MTAWGFLSMNLAGFKVSAVPATPEQPPRDIPPTVIANAVKQTMSRSRRCGEVVGSRPGAAWIGTGLTALAMTAWGVLAMNRVGFKVSAVPATLEQPDRNDSQITVRQRATR